MKYKKQRPTGPKISCETCSRSMQTGQKTKRFIILQEFAENETPHNFCNVECLNKWVQGQERNAAKTSTLEEEVKLEVYDLETVHPNPLYVPPSELSEPERTYNSKAADTKHIYGLAAEGKNTTAYLVPHESEKIVLSNSEKQADKASSEKSFPSYHPLRKVAEETNRISYPHFYRKDGPETIEVRYAPKSIFEKIRDKLKMLGILYKRDDSN